MDDGASPVELWNLDWDVLGSAKVVVRNNVVVRVYEVDTEVSLLKLPVVTRGNRFDTEAPDLPVRSQVDHVVHGSGSGVQEAIDEKVIAAVAVELKLGNRGAFVPEADPEEPVTLWVEFDV
jgi:hypothetical protein